ncbi:MmcQ/YjbR family DNA-binding protein [Limosilactobacillus mucosae]|uniref:MmcQ/YjbR family DNA-binding protein n=1 Tax=Limosilactobacillus mucosae TaxID=97478 RepID=UPI003993E5B2
MVRLIDDVFKNQKFIPEQMSEFDFQKTGNTYTYEENFLDGSFRAVVTVENGKVNGQVIDCSTGDEYYQVDVPAMQGKFVSSVRAGYLDILGRIADHCCQAVLFASPQANRITAKIYDRYHVAPDFPWQSKSFKAYGVFRHLDSGKWFGLIMNVKRGLVTKNDDEQTVDIINLKSDSMPLDDRSVFPSYHMNHKYWISVILDDQLSDDDLMKMIDESFRLTGK